MLKVQQLNIGDAGAPQFEMCCHDFPQGPCDAVIIGKIGGQWEDLTQTVSILCFDGACVGLLVMNSQHCGFHDSCLPNTCSPIQDRNDHTCVPAMLQFNDGQYQTGVFPLTNPRQ